MPDKCISSIEEEEPHTTLPDGNDHDNKDDHHCYAYWFFLNEICSSSFDKKKLFFYIYMFVLFQSFQCVLQNYILCYFL